MYSYHFIKIIGEGAHGTVWKAKCNEDKKIYALKKVSLKKLDESIPNAALREIKALQQIQSEYIVRLHHVFADGPGFVLTFDYMLSDLSVIIKNAEYSLTEDVIKAYAIMIMKGVAYCHKLGIIHRDLKPANVLVSEDGILKIADFGLARVYSDDESKVYSHQVCTRWYRAPELLYGSRKYDESIDLWGIGCIIGEMLNGSPLFPGESDIEQLCLVLKTLGTPTEETWPGIGELPDYNKITFPRNNPIPMDEVLPEASPAVVNLVQKFLCYPPNIRMTAANALLHEYFFADPLPCVVHELPKPSDKSVHRPNNELQSDCLRSLESTLIDPFSVGHVWK